MEEDSWRQWSKFVLKELERGNDSIEQINSRIRKIEIDIAINKVKAGFWGAVGASLPVIALAVYQVYK